VEKAKKKEEKEINKVAKQMAAIKEK